MDFMYVSYEIKDKVASIMLNRPQALNAISRQMERELWEAFDRFEKDSRVNVAVLSSAGDRAFSAGADTKETGGVDDKQYHKADDMARREHLGKLSKPVLCSIQGYCLGAGLQLALKCDIRVASDDAQFGFPEINLGMMAIDGATQRLPRLVGVSRALRMLLTGERIGAVEALSYGLVDKVVARSELASFSQELAKSIATKDTHTVGLIRQAVYEGSSMPLDRALQLELDLSRPKE